MAPPPTVGDVIVGMGSVVAGAINNAMYGGRPALTDSDGSVDGGASGG